MKLSDWKSFIRNNFFDNFTKESNAESCLIKMLWVQNDIIF